MVLTGKREDAARCRLRRFRRRCQHREGKSHSCLSHGTGSEREPAGTGRNRNQKEPAGTGIRRNRKEPAGTKMHRQKPVGTGRSRKESDWEGNSKSWKIPTGTARSRKEPKTRKVSAGTGKSGRKGTRKTGRYRQEPKGTSRNLAVHYLILL